MVPSMKPAVEVSLHTQPAQQNKTLHLNWTWRVDLVGITSGRGGVQQGTDQNHQVLIKVVAAGCLPAEFLDADPHPSPRGWNRTGTQGHQPAALHERLFMRVPAEQGPPMAAPWRHLNGGAAGGGAGGRGMAPSVVARPPWKVLGIEGRGGGHCRCPPPRPPTSIVTRWPRIVQAWFIHLAARPGTHAALTLFTCLLGRPTTKVALKELSTHQQPFADPISRAPSACSKMNVTGKRRRAWHHAEPAHDDTSHWACCCRDEHHLKPSSGPRNCQTNTRCQQGLCQSICVWAAIKQL